MKNYEFCILTNDEDIIEYEKGLYDSYSQKDADGWIFNNYEMIDNCRLKPNIDYKDLVVYGYKDKNKLIAGAAINYNMAGTLQLEQMGFKIEKTDKKFCEGLNLFATIDMSENLMLTVGDFHDLIVKDIKNRGVEIVYGTCEDEIKGMYSIFGWDIMYCINLENVKEFLMIFDIKNNNF